MPRLFLPFTPQGERTELAAIAVKRHLGLAAHEAVDPFAVLPDVPARLVDTALLDPALLAHCAEDWSGIGFGCAPSGEELIGLNPKHSASRQRATLMEEIVHIILDHPKTTIMVGTNAMSPSPRGPTDRVPRARRTRGSASTSVRTFAKDIEDDAFNIGAACVVPYPSLFDAVRTRGEHATTIANRYKLSPELIAYRIKRAGLFQIYRKQHL